MHIRHLAWFWLSAATAWAQGPALIGIGDSWKFIPILDAPTVPDDQWKLPGFDDRFWLTGRSGFSVGYGSEEATTLPYTPANYSSVFFRRSFVLTNHAEVKWLILRVDYTDGFVAYLNGEEIARRNLDGAPGSPVPFSQLATNYHVRGWPEEIALTSFTNLLVSAENTLAVQVHSADPWNSGICFIPELLANFTRAPHLQNTSSNRVQIIWKTPVPADTAVSFGRRHEGLTALVVDTNLVTTHVASLTDLTADTLYEYHVSSTVDGQTVRSAPATFRTFKTAGPISFVTFGDGGWNSLAQYQIADVIRACQPDLVLEAGDIVYPAFTSALADSHLFSVYGRHMASTPYFFAIGNHDIYGGVGHYLQAFFLPTNSVALTEHAAAFTSPEHYYSFDHGDVHFVVLYVPFLNQYRPRIGDAQHQWLIEDLAATRKPWKIALWHVPMSSSSLHRLDDMDLSGTPDGDDIRDVFLPVLSQYGVQLVLCGHEHGYERFVPVNGVHALTSAGGGAVLYGFSQLDPLSAFYWSRFNCVQVLVNEEELEARALGQTGEVFDRMIIRRLPSRQSYDAVWHSPQIEASDLADSTGNIPGQVFDFAGQAISAVSGRFSNLGRAYVNHDATNLYVGFEGVMLADHHDLMLFIASPRLPGVVNLLPVGDGRFDPEGEGVDGLDFLSNLGFREFSPAIGVSLGDELADAPTRHTVSTNSSTSLGQGVFRLDRPLSNVPGARVQQFHASPEDSSLQSRRKAGFIEPSVPLAELGSPEAGDEIQIGAVVAGGLDLAGEKRWLDTGFLGTGLFGAGLDAATLEPVRVRLTVEPQSDPDQDGLPTPVELSLGTDPEKGDSDADGLSDRWEVIHQLDPNLGVGEAGPGGDPDADGASNWAELCAGTNPRDPHSVLRIEVQWHGDKVRLVWPGVPGRTYYVESRTVKERAFQVAGEPGLTVGGTATHLVHELVAEALGPESRLFRVRVAAEHGAEF